MVLVIPAAGELWHLTLTFELSIDSIKMDQCTKYLDQRSFSLKVNVVPHTDTDRIFYLDSNKRVFVLTVSAVVWIEVKIFEFLVDCVHTQGSRAKVNNPNMQWEAVQHLRSVYATVNVPCQPAGPIPPQYCHQADVTGVGLWRLGLYEKQLGNRKRCCLQCIESTRVCFSSLL